MEKKNNSYNLVIGVAALIVIILVIAIIGYIVSKPKPLVIQGEVLSIITFGIGYFWLVPYAQTAQASFYQDVKAEWEAGRTLAAEPAASRPEPVQAPPVREVREENPEDYMPK